MSEAAVQALREAIAAVRFDPAQIQAVESRLRAALDRQEQEALRRVFAGASEADNVLRFVAEHAPTILRLAVLLL